MRTSVIERPKETAMSPEMPSAEIVFVTPQMANQWLEKNTSNRHARERDIERFARDMKRGKWQFNGQTIVFSNTGHLLDGQHRLMAIATSGRGAPTAVVRGVDPSAQATMDSGRRRTSADDLTIHKVANAVHVAAIARLALGVESGIEGWDRFEATHGEIADWVEKHPEVHEFAEFAKTVSHRSMVPAAMVGYTLFRFHQLDAIDDGYDFWTAAANKIGLREGDPTIALTNRLSDARRVRERLSKQMYASLIFRAWNARRAGKPMKVLRLNSPAGGLTAIPDLK